MDLVHLELLRITDPEVFEEMCADLLRLRPGYTHVDRNGAPGQRQNGVDIFGRNREGRWVGLQCKVRDRALAEGDVLADLRKARAFEPRLALIEFFTTARRDVALQAAVRRINDSGGGPAVSVVFWEEIERLVKLPEHRLVLRRYFSGVLIDAKALGEAYGTLVSLRLGVDGRFDTCHELMVVATRPTDRGHNGLDYHRGVHYLVALNSLIVAKFRPGRVFASDFKHMFASRLDQHMVAEWLNAQNIDDLIFGAGAVDAAFSMSREEWLAFPRSTEPDDE